MLQHQLAAHAVVVGSFWCSILSSTLRGRCSSAMGNVVIGAVKKHSSIFQSCAVRPEPASAVVLSCGAARASTRAHRRTCAGPATRKTFDHEATSKLKFFFLSAAAVTTHGTSEFCSLQVVSFRSSPGTGAIFCFATEHGLVLLVWAQSSFRTARCSVPETLAHVSR